MGRVFADSPNTGHIYVRRGDLDAVGKEPLRRAPEADPQPAKKPIRFEPLSAQTLSVLARWKGPKAKTPRIAAEPKVEKSVPETEQLLSTGAAGLVSEGDPVTHTSAASGARRSGTVLTVDRQQSPPLLTVCFADGSQSTVRAEEVEPLHLEQAEISISDTTDQVMLGIGTTATVFSVAGVVGGVTAAVIAAPLLAAFAAVGMGVGAAKDVYEGM